MRVCVLTHTFPRNKEDVAAAFMKGFADGLIEAGNDVVVVTPFDREFRREGDLFKIVTYKYIWPSGFHLLGYSRTMEADVALRKRAYLLLPFMLIFGTITLLRAVRREKVDIINVHWILPNGLMALVVSKITKVPFVVTIPGTDAYLAYRYKLFGWIAKFIAKNTSGIISNSSLHLKRILNLGIDNKPTAVISYPTDVSLFRPITTGLERYRAKHNLTKSNFVVLAIGRLVYKKGFDYLIKAVAGLAKRYPQIRLIIGGDGDLRNEWEGLAKKLEVKDKALFLGNIPRNEAIYYYNLSDVLIAPSIIDKKGNVDGGPVVSFESMACGKPQIVTNVLGVADIIKNNVNGFVIPEKDYHAIAVALEKLIKSPILRIRMGEANRKLIKSELNTKKIGQKYTRFFNQVSSSHK